MKSSNHGAFNARLPVQRLSWTDLLDQWTSGASNIVSIKPADVAA